MTIMLGSDKKSNSKNSTQFVKKLTRPSIISLYMLGPEQRPNYEQERPSTRQNIGRWANRVLDRRAPIEIIAGAVGVGESVGTAANWHALKPLESSPLSIPGMARLLAEAGVSPSTILAFISICGITSVGVLGDGARRLNRQLTRPPRQ